MARAQTAQLHRLISASTIVSRLTLTEFRCYGHARIEPEAGSVVLTGPNGAGKTNLLEAISLLSPGRGLRSARSADFQRIGSAEGAYWGVAAAISGPEGETLVGTGREVGTERRGVAIDGKAAKSQSALAEIVPVVWLTPLMDRLFVEGAKGRRKFLDRLIFGLDPAHAGRVTRHDAALRQRARLLLERPGESAWLDAIEAELAATGVALAAARADMAERLARALAQSAGFRGRSWRPRARSRRGWRRSRRLRWKIGCAPPWRETAPATRPRAKPRSARIAATWR
jgi:DNA replication and repair protein RecF